jgi:hypothetical protein
VSKTDIATALHWQLEARQHLWQTFWGARLKLAPRPKYVNARDIDQQPTAAAENKNEK